MTDSYEDIIALPHHVSDKHPHMSLHDRAAQFAPFAALVGYEDAIAETSRVTEDRQELDEHEKAELDRRLQLLEANASACPRISLTYFTRDKLKQGGKYTTATGNLQRISRSAGSVMLTSGRLIPLNGVTAIESPLFDALPTEDDM